MIASVSLKNPGTSLDNPKAHGQQVAQLFPLIIRVSMQKVEINQLETIQVAF